MKKLSIVALTTLSALLFATSNSALAAPTAITDRNATSTVVEDVADVLTKPSDTTADQISNCVVNDAPPKPKSKERRLGKHHGKHKDSRYLPPSDVAGAAQDEKMPPANKEASKKLTDFDKDDKDAGKKFDKKSHKKPEGKFDKKPHKKHPHHAFIQDEEDRNDPANSIEERAQKKLDTLLYVQNLNDTAKA